MKTASVSQNTRISIEAEQALLGILFSDPSAMQTVRPFLRPVHFSEPLHSRLYEAFEAEFDKGAQIAPMAIASRFAGEAAMIDLGGFSYVSTMMGSLMRLAVGIASSALR